MGGMGVTKLTRDSAAVAGMCSATSALARMSAAWAKRDGLGWICKLIEDTLADPAQGIDADAPQGAERGRGGRGDGGGRRRGGRYVRVECQEGTACARSG